MFTSFHSVSKQQIKLPRRADMNVRVAYQGLTEVAYAWRSIYWLDRRTHTPFLAERKCRTRHIFVLPRRRPLKLRVEVSRAHSMRNVERVLAGTRPSNDILLNLAML